MIVYLDKQANGAAAVVTDVLETASIDSFRNLANSGRFQVLKDRVVTLNATGGNFGSGGYGSFLYGQSIKWNKGKMNVPLEFSSTVGTLTELRSNNLGIMFISENGLIQISYTSRLRFTG